MATVAMIGFEWGRIDEIPLIAWNGDVSISTSIKRSGERSLRVPRSSFDTFELGDYFYLYLPFSLNEFYIQFALYINEDNYECRFWFFKIYDESYNNSIASLFVDHPSRLLKIILGNTTMGFSSTTILPFRWYVFEIYLKISPTEGIYQVKIDGNLEFSYSGNTGTYSARLFRWSNFYSGEYYVDDIIINDTTGLYNNSWSNGAKIILLKPNVDGSIKEWIPSSGNDHYQLVDEIPPSMNDYLRTYNVNEQDIFGFENLPSGVVNEIKAVKLDVWGLKHNSYSPNKLKSGLRINGNNYFSDSENMAMSMKQHTNIWYYNPSTGNPFTIADINNLEAIIESDGE